MTEYVCNQCPGDCKLTTEIKPESCISSKPLISNWLRVASAPAIESESIIHGYTFRAQEIEINTKQDVNQVIQQLQDCITDLVSVEWPEDKEAISKLLQVTA